MKTKHSATTTNNTTYNDVQHLCLPARNFCIRIRPISITNCTPGSIVEQLHSSHVGVIFVIYQTDSFNTISSNTINIFKNVTDSLCVNIPSFVLLTSLQYYVCSHSWQACHSHNAVAVTVICIGSVIRAVYQPRLCSTTAKTRESN